MGDMRAFLLKRAAGRQRPVAVMDANLLRNARVIAKCQKRYESYGEQIVIADAVWDELVANESWPSTLRASLQHLASMPEALVASWSVAAMQAGERKNGEPARDVVHGPMTGFLRKLVVELARGGSNVTDRLRGAVRKHGFAEKGAMGARRKEATKRLVELGRQGITSDRLNAVKTALQVQNRGPLLDLVVEVFEPEKVGTALVRQGVDAAIAKRLVSQPSVNVITNLFFTHMAVEWTVTHGIENAKLSRIHNDYVDVEYAVVAWVCGGDYITADQRARQRFEEVTALSGRLWPAS
jgi:hypothetical protein